MTPAPGAARKKMLCIGFDAQHPDFGPLTGAVEDARRWSSFVGERLDFEVRLVTDKDMPRAGGSHGLNLLSLLDEEVSDLGPGDLFGLFLATHGKEIRFKDGQRERLFTLPITSNAMVNDYVNDPASKRFMTGGLFVTLSQLEGITSRPGLRRFFVLDACRSLVDLSLPTANRKGEREPFDGQTIDRAMQLRISARERALLSPLTTVNSCSDGQVAKELKQERGGAFTLSGIKVLRERHQALKPLRFDEAFVADVEAAMRMEAARLDAQLDGQRPSVSGQGVELWSMSQAQLAQLLRLQAAFDNQLQTGALEAPSGDCARDTLSQIRALDIPQVEKDALQQRLNAAIEEDRVRRHRAHDEALVARARASDSVDDWNAVLYRARLDATRDVASQALQRLRHCADDDEAWRTALAFRTVAAVDRYLDRFAEQARHLAEAQELKVQLEREEEERAERDAWRLARQSDTIEGYAKFVADWPDSPWMDQARDRLVSLQRDDEAARTEAEAWAALDSTAPLPDTEQGFAQRLQQLNAFCDQFPRSRRAWADFRDQLHQGLQRLREQEQADWNAAEGANTSAAYERYRDAWPTSARAMEAVARIAEITRNERDLAVWRSSELANTIAAYERYLKDWPTGNHAVEAIARIAELKRLADAAAAAAAEQLRRREEAALARLQSLQPTTPSQLQSAIAEADAFTEQDFGSGRHAEAVRRLRQDWSDALFNMQRHQAEHDAWQLLEAKPRPTGVATAREQIEQARQHLRTWGSGPTSAAARNRIAELDRLVGELEAIREHGASAAHAELQALRPASMTELKAAIAKAHDFLLGDFSSSKHADSVRGLLRPWERAASNSDITLEEFSAWNALHSLKQPATLSEARDQLTQLQSHVGRWPQGVCVVQAKEKLERLQKHVRALEQAAERARPPLPPSPQPPAPPTASGSSPTRPLSPDEPAAPVPPKAKPEVHPAVYVGLGTVAVGLVAALAWLVSPKKEPAPTGPMTVATPSPAPQPAPQPPRDVKPLVWPTLSPRAVWSTLASPGGKLPMLSRADVDAVKATLAKNLALDRMSADELLIVAGSATLGWPNQPVDPGKALTNYIEWFSRFGAANTDQRREVTEVVTLLLKIKPSAGLPPVAWDQIQLSLKSPALEAQGLPTHYWQGSILYCLLTPPDPVAAKESLTLASRRVPKQTIKEADYASASETMLVDHLNKGETCAQMNAKYDKR